MAKVICQTCGKKNKKGSLFCAGCGANLTEQISGNTEFPNNDEQGNFSEITGEISQNPAQPKKRKMPIILGACAAVVVVAGIAIYAGSSSSEDEICGEWFSLSSLTSSKNKITLNIYEDDLTIDTGESRLRGTWSYSNEDSLYDIYFNQYLDGATYHELDDAPVHWTASVKDNSLVLYIDPDDPSRLTMFYKVTE